jgi:hypothetical protein
VLGVCVFFSFLFAFFWLKRGFYFLGGGGGGAAAVAAAAVVVVGFSSFFFPSLFPREMEWNRIGRRERLLISMAGGGLFFLIFLFDF